VPAKRKYSITETEIQPWINEHSVCLQNYLNHLNAEKNRLATEIYLYCEWVGQKQDLGKPIEPEALLELKTGFNDYRAENLLESFIAAETVFPDVKKWTMHNTIHAFFGRNHRPLDSKSARMERPESKDRPLPSKKNRVALVEACYTPRDRALIVYSCSTAIARETMAKLQWCYFEDDWEKQETPSLNIPGSILKGHGKGKYRGTRQIAFLTPEAKQLTFEYRDWYSKTFNHRWVSEDFVFLNDKGAPGEPITPDSLSEHIWTLSKRAGISFGIHDGRDIVQTALESVGCPQNWVKKIKGRKCSGEERPYSKPAIDQLRGFFVKALSELEFLAKSQVVKANTALQQEKERNVDLMIERQSLKASVAQQATELSGIKRKLQEQGLL